MPENNHKLLQDLMESGKLQDALSEARAACVDFMRNERREAEDRLLDDLIAPTSFHHRLLQRLQRQIRKTQWLVTLRYLGYAAVIVLGFALRSYLAPEMQENLIYHNAPKVNRPVEAKPLLQIVGTADVELTHFAFVDDMQMHDQLPAIGYAVVELPDGSTEILLAQADGSILAITP